MLEIIEAWYSTLNVTKILNDKILNDKLEILVNNDIFTDPQHGVLKKLNVKYKLNNSIYETFAYEHEILKLPIENELEFNSNNEINNISIIKKTYKNIFFFWEGSIPENRFKILEDSIYSARIFNIDRPIYLISNSINKNKFKDIFNINVIRWDESFFDECNIPIEFLRKYYFNSSPRDLSDLFRIVLLHKFGGTYIDTDDISIKSLTDVKNIFSRTYDPHTCFYSNISNDDCINGKYREIRGYDNIPFFVRNDCLQNFEPNNSILLELLKNKNITNIDRAIYISDDFSWQSMLFNTIKNNLDKNNKNFEIGLTLLYLYEDFVSGSSSYDRCVNGGEMCDIYDNLPNIKNYLWGEYRCKKEVAENFLNIIIDKYPYLSSFWLHLKDAQKEWFVDIDESGEYLLSTWLYYFTKEKIKKYQINDNLKFSVIIPTMWKSKYIYNLIDNLKTSNYVGEIIIIDNNINFNKNIECDNKIKIIKNIKNIYVNPSWNLGVNMSKYDNLIICNDDIYFDTNVLEYISNVLKNKDIGIIGQESGIQIEQNKNTNNKNWTIKKIKTRPSAWGCLMFLKKENWTYIPDMFKIACGDDFLIENLNSYSIENLNIIGDVSTTCNTSEFIKISENDILLYKKYKSIGISVLTLTYQRYDMLEEAIQSYLNQYNLENSEMVIINDSPDVKYYFDHPNVKIINLDVKFTSLLKKIQYGYKLCKYEYIFRLDDDDLLLPWSLSLTREYICENENFDVYRSEKHYFFSNEQFVDCYGNVNNGNVYKKNYLDKISYTDVSFGEDELITFNKIAKTKTVDKNNYTMIYRWNNNSYNLSHAGTTDNDSIMNYVDNLRKKQNNKESGTIILKPNFKKNYYSQLKYNVNLNTDILLQEKSLKNINYPKISCICPTRGRFESLRESISFFILQDYPNKELIIFNNHPIPLNIHPKLKKHNIFVINGGDYSGQPIGKIYSDCLKYISNDTEYISIWDDDDVYFPWHLSSNIKKLKNSNKKLISSIYGYWLDINNPSNEYDIVSNVLEASMIVEKSYINFNINAKFGEHDYMHPHTYWLNKINKSDIIYNDEISAIFRLNYGRDYHHLGTVGPHLNNIDSGNNEILKPKSVTDIFYDFFKKVNSHIINNKISLLNKDSKFELIKKILSYDINKFDHIEKYKVWQYWDNNTPVFIKKCFKSVNDNTFAECVFLNDEELKKYNLPDYFWELNSPVYKSEFIRIYFLNTYGGWWFDADTYIVGDLDEHYFRFLSTHDNVFPWEYNIEGNMTTPIFSSKPNTLVIRTAMKYIEEYIKSKPPTFGWATINIKGIMKAIDDLRPKLNDITYFGLPNIAVYYNNHLISEWDFSNISSKKLQMIIFHWTQIGYKVSNELNITSNKDLYKLLDKYPNFKYLFELENDIY